MRCVTNKGLAAHVTAPKTGSYWHSSSSLRAARSRFLFLSTCFGLPASQQYEAAPSPSGGRTRMQIRQPGRISTSSPLAAGIGLLAAFATLSPVGVLNAQAIGPQASPITRQQAEPQAARGEEQEPAVELSLLDAVDLALRHNLQVQINSYQPDLSEEQITNARRPVRSRRSSSSYPRHSTAPRRREPRSCRVRTS